MRHVGANPNSEAGFATSICSRTASSGAHTARNAGAAGTGVSVGGETKAGIAWFKVLPKINGIGKVEGAIDKQGYIALADNNLTMPALATSTCTGPCASSISLNARSTSATAVTSHLTARHPDSRALAGGGPDR